VREAKAKAKAKAKANEAYLIYEAFRYTLDKVGIDPNAIGIYNDHANIRSQPSGVGA